MPPPSRSHRPRLHAPAHARAPAGSAPADRGGDEISLLHERPHPAFHGCPAEVSASATGGTRCTRNRQTWCRRIAAARRPGQCTPRNRPAPSHRRTGSAAGSECEARWDWPDLVRGSSPSRSQLPREVVQATGGRAPTEQEGCNSERQVAHAHHVEAAPRHTRAPPSRSGNATAIRLRPANRGGRASSFNRRNAR